MNMFVALLVMDILYAHTCSYAQWQLNTIFSIYDLPSLPLYEKPHLISTTSCRGKGVEVLHYYVSPKDFNVSLCDCLQLSCGGSLELQT